MLPQRITLTIMGFLAIAIISAMRACFSITITEMVMPIENAENRNTSIDNSTLGSQSIHSTETKYNWTQAQQGWILSSYFAGYSVGHIPVALLSHKFSGKWMLTLSVLVSCIFFAVTPFILTYGRLDILIVIRVVMGLFGGMSFPAVTTLLSSWVPSKERATLGSIVLGGGQFGNIVAFYTSGLLLTFFSWPVVFYFWGIISIIWSIGFAILCYDNPASHPFISKSERDYLRSEINPMKHDNELPPTPWKQIFVSTPVIAIIISQLGNDCVYSTVFTHLPKYMKEILGLKVHEIGLYTALPSLSMWVASIALGFLCDTLIVRQYLKIVQARKLFTVLSGIVPPILLLIISYEECNRIGFIILIVLTAIFMGAYYPGMRVNILDLTPNYAGVLLAYTNGIGCIGSFIFPGIIGMIITDSTIEQWRFVFKILLVISLVRTAIYTIWASGNVQSWNNPVRQDLLEGHTLTNASKNDTKTDAID